MDIKTADIIESNAVLIVTGGELTDAIAINDKSTDVIGTGVQASSDAGQTIVGRAVRPVYLTMMIQCMVHHFIMPNQSNSKL